MQNGIFTLSWANIKSALVYGLLSGLLAVLVYVVSVGDVFALDSHALINAGVFGLAGSIVSIVKNLLTTDSGKFLGAIKTTPPTE